MNLFQARISASESKISELQRELANAKNHLADERKSSEKINAQQVRCTTLLTEEKSRLLLELESRPTCKEMQSAKRQVTKTIRCSVCSNERPEKSIGLRRA